MSSRSRQAGAVGIPSLQTGEDVKISLPSIARHILAAHNEALNHQVCLTTSVMPHLQIMHILTDEEIVSIRDALLLGHEEPFDCVAFARAVLSRALPPQPSPGLLMSMAIRYDHGLGVPGYYGRNRSLPASLVSAGVAAEENGAQSASYKGRMPSHADRLRATLSQMRQLYEEVSGQGFYDPSREEDYCNIQKQGLSSVDASNPSDAPTAGAFISGNSDGTPINL